MMIHNKSMIYYLLSYFMLVDITNVPICGYDKKKIESFNLDKYGLNILYDYPKKKYLLFMVVSYCLMLI